MPSLSDSRLTTSERRLLVAEAKALIHRLAPEGVTSPEELERMAHDLGRLAVSGIEAAIAAVFAEVVRAEADRLRRRLMH